MNVLTACSGIGAPEYAWRDLPFNFIGCSEIEAFPSAVLKHHYPAVKNYGDMTKYRDWKLDEPASIIFAGTPCVSFSVAGLRQGMDSPNGNLALVFLGMVERFNPRWVLWENVPGVLSSRSNGRSDFGALLGALRKLGFGYCYRVLDAQHFGVPQRRRRVFVVGYFGDWRPAAAVLFERESLSGDIAQSERKKQINTAEIGSSSEAAVYENHATDSRVKEVAVCPTVRANWSKGSTIPLVRHTVYENHATDSRVREVDVCPTITRRWGTGGNNTPLVLNRLRGFGDYVESETASTIQARDYKYATDLIEHQKTVRRLIPAETELLMGFEKGYTDITYRSKPASDANRYKALGNSMAVPVVRWLGQRLLMVEEAVNG